MTVRLFAAFALAVCLSPLAVRADDHPYQNTKPGDYATYKMKVKIDTLEIDGNVTQTVIAKTDKDVKLKVVASVGGMEAPAQEQTIDLSKPFDPTNLGQLPPGLQVTVEKSKESKEKLKVGTKEIECTLTTYKVKGKANNQDIDVDVKVWTAKEVTMTIAKLEMTGNVAKSDVRILLEFTEGGNKPLTTTEPKKP